MDERPIRRLGKLPILLIMAAFLFGCVFFLIHRGNLDSLLINAIRNSDAETAHSLLQSGADPNARLENLKRPDENQGLASWVKSLFSRGVRPKTNNNRTALMLAVGSNQARICDDLL